MRWGSFDVICEPYLVLLYTRYALVSTLKVGNEEVCGGTKSVQTREYALFKPYPRDFNIVTAKSKACSTLQLSR